MTTNDVPPASRALALPAASGAVMPGTPEFEQTVSHMAREFAEATAEIVRLGRALKAQTDRLREAFRCESSWRSDFEISFQYAGDRHIQPDNLDKLLASFKRRAWETLVDHLGIKNIMSVAKRRAFEEQLQKGDLPDINPQAITGILLGLVGQAQDFAREAAREVFEILRPRHPIARKYATNDAFRVGRRVILPWYVEGSYGPGKYRVSHSHDAEVRAIDAVFHLLDGKGVIREPKGPLAQAIEASLDGRGRTSYFSFRAYKNRNLHLEFLREDLVKQLNGLAAGEYVLGDDVD